MDITFHGLIGQSVVVYIDDMFVFSIKLLDHIFLLKKIFERCYKYEISFNHKKSVFAVPEGNLLGHIIARSRIKDDPNRVRTIKQIPQPANRKAMKSFLGKINFL